MDNREVTALIQHPRLVGDGIENPANARALMDAAAMFRVACYFRDTRGLATAWDAQRGGKLDLITTPQLVDESWPIVAIENAPDASIIFGASQPAARSSIVVGGERLGVRADLLRASARKLQIPMPGRGINTLNVACAAAVALYYLLAERRLGPRHAKRTERRPALLLWRPSDHVEAGSAIRSAAAFGWRTVGLEDSEKVWFGVSRAVTAEGRAAARSHRNLTRVLPMTFAGIAGFRRVIVAGARVDGPPLHRADLARPDSLLVIPDERDGRVETFDDLGGVVEPVRINLPAPTFPYRYRLVASIVLAEAARQSGLGPAVLPRLPVRRRPTYESTLSTVAAGPADEVEPAVLNSY